MIDHDLLERQAEKQRRAVAALREVIVQLLAIVDELAGAAQVTLPMAELSKPKDEGKP